MICPKALTHLHQPEKIFWFYGNLWPFCTFSRINGNIFFQTVSLQSTDVKSGLHDWNKKCLFESFSQIQLFCMRMELSGRMFKHLIAHLQPVSPYFAECMPSTDPRGTLHFVLGEVWMFILWLGSPTDKCFCCVSKKKKSTSCNPKQPHY